MCYMTVNPVLTAVFRTLLHAYPSSSPEKPGGGTGLGADDRTMWQVVQVA